MPANFRRTHVSRDKYGSSVSVSFELEWNGDEVAAAVREAAADGINETAAEAVSEARADAPKRTGRLARAIRVVDKADAHPSFLRALWGVSDKRVRAVVQLYRSKLLHRVAARVYPRLPHRIRRKLEEIGPK